MADVDVQAQRLPGVGWHYSVPAEHGAALSLVVEDRGFRHLAVTDPGSDESPRTVRLGEAQAAAVAALLTGARFDLRPADEQGSDEPGTGGRRAPLAL
ncbi:hypothetical protein I4I73_06080 [Pseudonocardia sp. KRD-184]|uniref:Potassium/proton antiporter subunit KhtT-like N-terminal domain-containing protein n=1 Tax=Pseudonocardia oceani TaxID=2792013 RepID=A0ABS6U940_9PSEU|nr:hypothetical protein [Pseudonocardia oceani]MBW0088689.1 hypothetical protein [Pseudonocardia oceani]MBW0095566.1 hypothetical protein [Pseudonocardia oceani]MBW0108196.1 hypothetical protein [Pseudonocardia oceani]MBW0120667.1 hypothetical protein [Pseudonocardia oceani]MBW0128399.1 hypothetical protein [Pseudonocardia oceani]